MGHPSDEATRKSLRVVYRGPAANGNEIWVGEDPISYRSLGVVDGTTLSSSIHDGSIMTCNRDTPNGVWVPVNNVPLNLDYVEM